MRKPLVGGLSLSTEGDDLAGCAGYLGYPFEKIGMVCMIDHVSLLKHVRCEYNERDLFCSYASFNAPISRRRGSIRALCLHLHQATSLFQLSRDPRTFVAVDQAIDTLTFARNGCRGRVTFLVCALMGFPDESAPPPSHVASSLQISRSELRHAHEGDTTMFHHVDHHALGSAMSGALGLWYAYLTEFRQVMINGRHQDHWWASGFAALPHHLRGHPSQVRAGPDRREEHNHDRPCGMR